MDTVHSVAESDMTERLSLHFTKCKVGLTYGNQSIYFNTLTDQERKITSTWEEQRILISASHHAQNPILDRLQT